VTIVIALIRSQLLGSRWLMKTAGRKREEHWRALLVAPSIRIRSPGTGKKQLVGTDRNKLTIRWLSHEE
jgi:hypothetical protein